MSQPTGDDVRDLVLEAARLERDRALKFIFTEADSQDRRGHYDAAAILRAVAARIQETV